MEELNDKMYGWTRDYLPEEEARQLSGLVSGARQGTDVTYNRTDTSGTYEGRRGQRKITIRPCKQDCKPDGPPKQIQQP
jgi:hypothetical protein